MGAPRPQASPPDAPILREAQPGEVWITRPTISGSLPQVSRPPALHALVVDSTPPTAPGNLVAESSGLFIISASWSPSSDPESGIQEYAFAIGTGTTPDTEANVRYWQIYAGTKLKVNLALTQGSTYYFSVYAINGANLSSAVTHSGPLIATPKTYGQPGNQLSYVISPTGYDASGAVTSTWPPDKLALLTSFLDKMLPVLYDLYGPPSTTYTVTVVRDLQYTSSAIFFPSLDEMHLGDSLTYQLLTHEMVHAWRRDEALSSGSVWQYDPTLSGFEEGFAQGVSYEAMTEFARRYPEFGLSQQIYQSSNEWDYDFQNVPELRTTDFWSANGGMLLHWIRYEMAAAAIAKIEWEHPGFHRAFNAEYYHRLNLDPHLTTSRDLVKDIVQTVAATIEGKPASQWIDEQYIFDCANHPGRKIFFLTQHDPAPDYFIFNRMFFYETFSNGSDWAYPDGSGGYIYYYLNGSPGALTLRTSSGDVVWQRGLLITPVDNPPVYYGFGHDEANLTTAADVSVWPPNADPSKYLLSISSLDLYRMSVQFTAGTTTTHDHYAVIGSPLRNTAGVFGGVAGANGGNIYLTHRNYPPAPPVPLVNRAFWTTTPWATLQHPATSSVDTDPGLIDVVYVDATGNIYKDVRTIGYGSSNGTQTFLFDVARMSPVAPVGPSITVQPGSRTATAGTDVQFTVAASGAPPPSYQWQVSSDGGVSWTNLTNVAPYSGVSTPALLITSVTPSLNGYRFRAVATNSLGSATSSAATLTVTVDQPTITVQPQGRTIASGQTATLSVAATGSAPLAYQWYIGTSGVTSNAIFGANSTTYTTPPLMSTTSYWVRVSNAYGSPANSNTATIKVYLPFTDEVLTQGSSLIRLVHITELRTRIDALRMRFGLLAFPWSDFTLMAGKTTVRAQHVADLREALSQAYANAGVTPMPYTEVITPGIAVKAAHISEIRVNVVNLELR